MGGGKFGWAHLAPKFSKFSRELWENTLGRFKVLAPARKLNAIDGLANGTRIFPLKEWPMKTERERKKNLKLKGYPTVKCLSFAINFLLTKRHLPPPVLCFSISKTQSFPGSDSRQSDSNNFLMIPSVSTKTQIPQPKSSKNFAAPKSQLHFLSGQFKRIIPAREIPTHPYPWAHRCPAHL